MPTIEMAMAEVIDLGNYSRYLFVKLYMLQQQMAAIQSNELKNATGFVTTPGLLGVEKI
jgi:hypothetical protein